MSISVPESRRIPHSLTEGNVIFIKGSVPDDANWFSINLCEGPTLEPRTHLHFNVRFDQDCVVRTHFDGSWGEEERDGGIPFKKGKKFKIRIHVTGDAYEIFVKKKKFCEFKYRLPKEDAYYLYISEGVNIDRLKFADGMGRDRKNPEIPFTMRMPGGLFPGMAIELKGRAHPGADRFHVNLVCGPNFDHDDVALHLDSRFSFGDDRQVVVRTSKIGGDWQEEEKDQDRFPFDEGGNFKLKIEIEDSEYDIYVNKQKFTSFKHRIDDLKRVDHLYVDGGVTIDDLCFC